MGIAKYGMILRAERDVSPATLTVQKGDDGIILRAVKRTSGYDDDTVMTLIINDGDAERLAHIILEGEDDGGSDGR